MATAIAHPAQEHRLPVEVDYLDYSALQYKFTPLDNPAFTEPIQAQIGIGVTGDLEHKPAGRLKRVARKIGRLFTARTQAKGTYGYVSFESGSDYEALDEASLPAMNLELPAELFAEPKAEAAAELPAKPCRYQAKLQEIALREAMAAEQVKTPKRNIEDFSFEPLFSEVSQTEVTQELPVHTSAARPERKSLINRKTVLSAVGAFAVGMALGALSSK